MAFPKPSYGRFEYWAFHEAVSLEGIGLERAFE